LKKKASVAISKKERKKENNPHGQVQRPLIFEKKCSLLPHNHEGNFFEVTVIFRK
jgi:hypothetical protein